jgi:hypothetical protein
MQRGHINLANALELLPTGHIELNALETLGRGPCKPACLNLERERDSLWINAGSH